MKSPFNDHRPASAGGLTVSNLSYSYGGVKALEAVSLRVESGRFCALLGPNGAGKSTLFALLTRLFAGAGGSISIAGADLAAEPLRALGAIGVVFQSSTLDLDLSVCRNLRYFAALHGMAGIEADKKIIQALERLEMRERASEKVRNLNGGHRRRTEIARALIHEPAILLLDEPTVGLDAATRKSITGHVHRLCIERDLTVLWATHLVDEVEDLDDLVILHRGKVIAQGRAGDIGGDDLSAKFLELTA